MLAVPVQQSLERLREKQPKKHVCFSAGYMLTGGESSVAKICAYQYAASPFIVQSQPR